MQQAKRRTVRQPEDSIREPSVYVVDPDPSLGNTVNDLLRGTELRCETFSSGREFFAAYDPCRPGCLVLELRIPDMSGLQIQRRLESHHSLLALVFVTSSADVSIAVELMRGGAVHVMEKPPRSIELWNAIQEGLAVSQAMLAAELEHETTRERIAGLTQKERKVLKLVAEGKSVKAIARELGLCVRAVELRRRNLMAKLQVRSNHELLRFSIVADNEFGQLVMPPASATRADANGHQLLRGARELVSSGQQGAVWQ